MAEVGKPGTNWKQVSPEHKRKIAPIVKHYAKMDHPFTQCVADNTKRFGPERAKRICAVVKDLGRRTTKWRKGGGHKITEAAGDEDAFIGGIFDDVMAPVLDAEGVSVDDLADWAELATDAGVITESGLALSIDTGDLRVLEATKPVAMSELQRNAGESLAAWGNRLKAGDQAKQDQADAAKKGKAKTRSGANQNFEKAHPRGRGGSWTLKHGASGPDVMAVQRRVGAKADGKFGDQTDVAVREFQRKHGLQVDGVVGAQTIASMRGNTNAANIKPGSASKSDRKWLAGRTKKLQESALGMTVTVESSPLSLRVGDDLRLSDPPELALKESYDLVVVETTDYVSTPMSFALLESASTVEFNDDGTLDFVIARPCNGRGEGRRIYEADMLERDAGVFAGWPSYDNHESEEARRARRGLPRPPSELAGEIRESWWDPMFTTPEDDKFGFGQGAVIGSFMLTEDMEKLVRRLPRAVKTSMNAKGTGGHLGTRNGKRGMIVEGILNDPEHSSVDLVTTAGAGGQVASLFRELAAAAA